MSEFDPSRGVPVHISLVGDLGGLSLRDVDDIYTLASYKDLSVDFVYQDSSEPETILDYPLTREDFTNACDLVSDADNKGVGYRAFNALMRAGFVLRDKRPDAAPSRFARWISFNQVCDQIIDEDRYLHAIPNIGRISIEVIHIAADIKAASIEAGEVEPVIIEANKR